MTQVLEPPVPDEVDGVEGDDGELTAGNGPAGPVLRSTTETAERERRRLEATAGKALVPAVMARLGLAASYAGTEEAARSGLRYQPVAWTAIAVVAVAFFFPGRVGDTVRLAASPLTRPPVTSVITTPTTEVVSDAVTEVTTPPVDVVTAPTPRLPPTAAPRPAQESSTVTTAPVSSAPEDETPLTVRGSGWASTLSGSPLSSSDVAEGTLPVANRLGQLDKASFVRLSGTATTLELREDPEGAREVLGSATVAICPIQEARWQEQPDQSFSDAPTWDAGQCIAGEEFDGLWFFDLSVFAERAGQNGFALVPGPEAPADFQITFALQS